MELLKSNSYENQIIETLVKEGLLSKDKINSLYEKEKEDLTSRKKAFFKKGYLLDHTNKKIIVLDNSLEKASEIVLDPSYKHSTKIEDFETWGRSILAFDDENTKKGQFFQKVEDKSGLLISNNNKAYLYNENIEKDKNLVELYNCIFVGIAKNKLDSLPLDLYLSNDCETLCVSDRGAGVIYLIDTKQDKILKSFQIRNSGSNKTINIVISKKQNKVLVSDNLTTNLTIINLSTLTSETKNLGLGILGNIALAPNEDALYCLSVKPKQTLKLIDLATYAGKKEFPLKGDLYSLGNVPHDLLALSTNKKFIYLMTHIPEPEPFTPVITVIEAEKEKATQRFSIKDGSKPINIGLSEDNPIFYQDKTTLELIVSNNLVKREKIQELKNKFETEKTQIEEFNLAQAQANIIEAAPGASSFSIPESEEEKKRKDVKWKISITPKKIEYYALSPALAEIFYKKCTDKIFSEYEYLLRDVAVRENWAKIETEIEFRFLKLKDAMDNPESAVCVRLNDAINRATQELEWHDVTLIQLSDFTDRYNFEISFSREDSIEWLRQKERDELIETGMRTIVSNCPNCNAQLLGSYTCRSCGFEIERPEDKVRSKLLKIATFDPFENLRAGHVMIIDKKNHKIMEVDHMRKVTWEIKKDVLSAGNVEVEFDMPRDAVRLRNNITLIVDYGSNRVFKLTQKGRIYWELDYEHSPEHKLLNPMSASSLESGNIIVVDSGNHRVFEVNMDQDIVWKYGQKSIQGIEYNQLRFPTFIQRTEGGSNIITDSGNHRIIEIQDGEIIWQYGNENNIEGSDAKGVGENQLNTPLSAWKYPNGNMLILDSGNKRAIEVNEKKEIIWEYRTDQAKEEANRIYFPFKAYKLKSDKTLIIGETKVIEVTYNNKRVAWQCSLEELFMEAEKDVTIVDEGFKRSKMKHGVVNPYAKRTDASDNFSKNKMDSFIESKKAELAAKIASQSMRSPVILTPGAKVSELEFLLIDKTKNSIYKINRKGETTWSWGEGILQKPVYIHDNLPKSIFIADGDAKKVIEVDVNTNQIIWEYQSQSPEGKLNFPRSVFPTESGTVLISDQLGNKVIEVDKASNEVVWDYKGTDLLGIPYLAKRLPNGNSMIVDWNHHMVFEVTKDKEVVWSYGTNKKHGNEDNMLSFPEFVSKLNNGNYLITDTKNSRIIEVTPDKKIIWKFESQGITKLMTPTFAKRLPDGNTLILHSSGKQVLEVDPQGKVLWKYMHQERKV